MTRTGALATSLVIAAVVLFDSAPDRTRQQRFITIGTAPVTSVYYTSGSAICRLLNRERTTHNIRCSVESTDGSIYNVNAIRAGQLEFGMMPSDVQFNALNGRGKFRSAGAFDDLRAVFSLNPELFTVLARKQVSATTFDDLKGMRVDVGNPSSGTRSSVGELLGALGWEVSDLALASGLNVDEPGRALCDNKIDAFFYGVGHPSANIQIPITICGARLVPILGPAVDQLVAERPYYAKATVPAGLYDGTPLPTETFGVLATLATSAAVPEDVVYELVKSVFDSFGEFRNFHPAFRSLDPAIMITEGLSAPLHPGAERYYKERGWVQ